ncbi:hypothetical protein [Kitasatospora sp. NPDC097691]|uniref:hypothetical protein n=1 Tax=Kitasatospora sp. NPDC097691 TaxID=3157231 RepID=UPI00332E286B
MVLLGLLLMAASGAFVGLLIADNLSGGPEYQVTVLGNDLVRMNSLGVFLAGVALALIFCLGLALMWSSRRRTVRPVAVAPPTRSGRHRAGYREAEPVEPVRRSAPAERAAPGYDTAAHDTPASDTRAYDTPADDAPVHDAPVHDTPARDISAAHDGRADGDPDSTASVTAAPGSDEALAPPEERAAEQGGREEPARPGGRIRHLFGS